MDRAEIYQKYIDTLNEIPQTSMKVRVILDHFARFSEEPERSDLTGRLDALIASLPPIERAHFYSELFTLTPTQS